jgi:hypothetical protein
VTSPIAYMPGIIAAVGHRPKLRVPARVSTAFPRAARIRPQSSAVECANGNLRPGARRVPGFFVNGAL